MSTTINFLYHNLIAQNLRENENRGAYISGMPPGWDCRVLGALVSMSDRPMVLVVPDDKTMALYSALFAALYPDITCLAFPPWDCVPYDRLSPKATISGARLACLTQLKAFRAEEASAQSTNKPSKTPWVLLTTPEGLIQKVPSPNAFAGQFLKLEVDKSCVREDVQNFCEAQGYARVGTVYEPGEYALRGGLIDLFPPQAQAPLRIDFFDTVVESIRVIEPLSQRSGASLRRLVLGGAKEIPHASSQASVSLFKDGFRQHFGLAALQDSQPSRLLQGRHVEGAEHWLPLFYQEMGNLSDYIPSRAAYVWHSSACDAVAASFIEEISDNYEHRITHKAARGIDESIANGDAPYRALPPSTLYNSSEAWSSWYTSIPWLRLREDSHPTQTRPDSSESDDTDFIPIYNAAGSLGVDFSTLIKDQASKGQTTEGSVPQGGINSVRQAAQDGASYHTLYAHVVQYLYDHGCQGKTPVLFASSTGRLQRLIDALKDAHTDVDVNYTLSFKPLGGGGISDDVIKMPSSSNKRLVVHTAVIGGSSNGVASIPPTRGFVGEDMVAVTDGDVMGSAIRGSGLQKHNESSASSDPDGALAARRVQDLIASMTNFTEGDYVVHLEHGIGKYRGLKTVAVATDDPPGFGQARPGAIDPRAIMQDFIEIEYADNAKLLVPVENLDLLSRFGSGENSVTLDKLGGSSWQTRRARVKKHLLEVAESLINTAALRQLQSVSPIRPVEGLYEEFCQGFIHDLTHDQVQAEQDIINDLASGSPMDRLICGDVGFGKTEIALRAAFMAVCQGQQVIVVVPTTLLCRQHYKTFLQRFSAFDVRIGQLSRLVKPAQIRQTRLACQQGELDIVIATHAAFGKGLAFKNLGLVIMDEEQHFGVAQKEYLKSHHPDVHLLTLSATPIPRTLQLSLSGIKSMSLIATPPVSRLAVRTFVMPYDAMVIREAVLREYFRGGQCFYVCPRLKDLPTIEKNLKQLVPEVSLAIAHGQLPAQELETIMQDFCDGKYDVLLSTNIIESGIDIPSANTLFVHRADMFGLAQLYQLRGRVGRGKTRGYAYFTLSQGKKVGATAKRRLKVMESLDALGAGFSIASHDMDIRGAGNLVGEAQAGHVQEVGVDLYQQMLKEAVALKKADVEHLLNKEKTSAKEVEDSEDLSSADDVQAEGMTSTLLNIGLSAYLPEYYIDDLSLRLMLYKRLAGCVSQQELADMQDEFLDRFGLLPPEVKNLFSLLSLKLQARRAGISRIDAGKKGAVITFRNNMFANPEGLIQFVQSQKGLLSLRPDHKIVLNRPLQDPQVRLHVMERLVQQLETIAVSH